MLRQRLKEYDRKFEQAEVLWSRTKNADKAVEMLLWCKRVRDMFDSRDGCHSDETGFIDEKIALVPMFCRVDVLDHNRKWAFRVKLWRERFNLSSVNASTCLDLWTAPEAVKTLTGQLQRDTTPNFPKDRGAKVRTF